MNNKLLPRLIGVTILAMFLISVGVSIGSMSSMTRVEYRDRVEVIEVTKTVSHLIRERVSFTAYWVNDYLGSVNITSSGLTTDYFDTNIMGWYTYQGHVVVATATTLCVEVQTGPCGNYNEYKDTHHYFNLFDVITIEVGGRSYSAIVLDSCGACNWDEELQRVDIFVSNYKFSIGKQKGSIIY